jgi:hypothetical protein
VSPALSAKIYRGRWRANWVCLARTVRRKAWNSYCHGVIIACRCLKEPENEMSRLGGPDVPALPPAVVEGLRRASEPVIRGRGGTHNKTLGNACMLCKKPKSGTILRGRLGRRHTRGHNATASGSLKIGGFGDGPASEAEPAHYSCPPSPGPEALRLPPAPHGMSPHTPEKVTVRVALPLTMASRHTESPSSRPEALAMPPRIEVLVSSGH